MNIFPELPKDLTGLTAEELQERLAEHRAVLAKVRDRDEETLGDLTMKDVLDQTQKAVEEIEGITKEMEQRGQADTEFQSKLDEFASQAGIDEPTEEEKQTDEVEAEAEKTEEAETVKAEAEEEEKDEEQPEAEAPENVVEEVAAEAETPEAPVAPEPVMAAARPARRSLPPRQRQHQPAPEVNETAAFVATAGLQGIEAGMRLDRISLANAMIEKLRAGASTAPGVKEKVLVARADYGQMFPEDRRLYNDQGDQDKIDAVTGQEALTAAGGLCAPVTPLYEISQVSVADRPVRNCLPGFNAVRGGVTLSPEPQLLDVTGVGIVTAADDALGGTFAVKSCQIVECPEFCESQLAQVYKCLQFGNLNSRAWPEMIANYNEKAMAAHARLAETALLDGIDAASTPVTTPGTMGAYSDLILAILQAAAAMRNRHRMDCDAILTVLLPCWVKDLIAADLGASQFDRLGQSGRASVEALLERAAIRVCWYLDGATGAGQVYGAQAAGVLTPFPTTVRWYIFPEGSFLFLDGGTLDLGIVRDSTLNSTNDFQIFAETFEAISCLAGVESLRVISTLCPSGETGLGPDGIGSGRTCA